MRHDKKRNTGDISDLSGLVGCTITGSDYMELFLEKDGKKYSLHWDYEYGYYDDVSVTYEIKEVT